MIFAALLVQCLFVFVLGHRELIYPCPRYEPNDSSCPALPSGQEYDYSLSSPISSTSDTAASALPLCKHTVPWPEPVATWNVGDTVNVVFKPGGAGHGGGNCEFSISYDGGKTFVVIMQVLQYCFFNGPSSSNTPEVSTYNVVLPEGLPSSDTAIFAWTWSNHIGNREFYMNCADVSIKGGTSESYTGKNITVVNYPGYPTIPEDDSDYTVGLEYYTSDVTYVTVYANGISEVVSQGAVSNNIESNASGNSSSAASSDTDIDTPSDMLNNSSSSATSSEAENDTPSDTPSDTSSTTSSDTTSDTTSTTSSDITSTASSDTSSDTAGDMSSSSASTTSSDTASDTTYSVSEPNSDDTSSDNSSSVEYSSDYGFGSVESSNGSAYNEPSSSESSNGPLTSTNSLYDSSSVTIVSSPLQPSSSEGNSLDPVESLSSSESHYAVPIDFANEPELVCNINSDDSLYYAYGDVYYSDVYVTYAYMTEEYVYNALVIETMEAMYWDTVTVTVTVDVTSTISEDSGSQANVLGGLDSESSS